MTERAVQVSQYCLDVIPAVGFVEKLPKKLRIVNMAVRGTYRMGRRKLALPEYLKKVGFSSASETASSIDVRGSFKGNLAKETMISSLKRAASSFKVPLEKFHIERVTLSDEKPTCAITFKRMFKQIKLPHDKRRKKLVLGMTSGDGKDYHNKILAVLSAKKITCTLAKTERTIVLCSEEIVTRKN